MKIVLSKSYYYLEKYDITEEKVRLQNHINYFREAINSVLNQTYRNFELIIINDGSTDTSVDIIQSYTDKRIRFLDNVQNKGVAFSRNLGLKEAKGEFLTWTDSDDINLPERFEAQVDFLLADAQSHAFEAGSYDLLVSRFGVMFFEDPVAAFGNLAKALVPGGRAGGRAVCIP